MNALKRAIARLAALKVNGKFQTAETAFAYWAAKSVNDGAYRQLKPVSWVHSNINERDYMARQIALTCEVQFNGRLMVGCYMEARDCDCVDYSSTSFYSCNYPAFGFSGFGIFGLWYGQEESYEYAEGPVRFSWFKPSESDDYKPYSHDRALEAYEDGHPSTVQGFGSRVAAYE